jgi:hypothetical protein
MARRRLVGEGQALGIEHPDLAPKVFQQAAGLMGEQAAIGDFAQGTIEDQDSRSMR